MGVEETRVSAAVGTMVLFWRQARGLTQQGLAERLSVLGRGLHPTAISRIEQGDRAVTVDELFALAVALNVSPMALIAPDSGVTPVVGEERRSAEEVRAWISGERSLGNVFGATQVRLDISDEFDGSAPAELKQRRRDLREWPVLRYLTDALEKARALAYATQAMRESSPGDLDQVAFDLDDLQVAMRRSSREVEVLAREVEDVLTQVANGER
jgi:transcriptional regulator with XRE-family HTH domain